MKDVNEQFDEFFASGKSIKKIPTKTNEEGMAELKALYADRRELEKWRSRNSVAEYNSPIY
jgi:hypothetical protein